MSENIISKIKKLLDKSNATDSKEESETFLLSAQRLLQKYNLEMSQVERHEIDNGIIEDFIKVDSLWQNILLKSIVDNNFCFCINTGDDNISICGKKHNVEIVEYMFSFFKRCLLDLSMKSYISFLNDKRTKMKEQGIDLDKLSGLNKMEKTYINDYLNGAVSGVCEKMRTQREEDKKQSSDLKSLIIVNDKEVALYFNSKYPERKTGKSRSKISSNEAFNSGYEDGKNLSFRGGVEKSNNNTKFIS